MRFKTHAERNGSLMFTVFNTEDEMHRALAAIDNDDLLFDEVVVLVEDGKSWRPIARSAWLADLPDKGTTELRSEIELNRWLDEVPVRWALFSDDTCLRRAISRTFWA